MPILIKDNHVALSTGVGEAVLAARAAYPHLHVQAEADTLEQLDDAIAAGADSVLLDNMSVPTLRAAVARAAGAFGWRRRAASPSRPCARSPRAASTPSPIGALTHSVRALDISLEVHPCPR